MPNETEREPISEIEVAIVDALKTILEVIVHAHPGAEKYLIRAFAHQRAAKLQTKQPHAAAVFELLRQFVADPTRQTNRAEIRKLLQEPPKGRA